MSKRFFDDIAGALDEAAAIARGEADSSTYRMHVPSDINVRAIRKRVGMTQEAFASTYGFPISTLRDWEQGRARPDTSARAYLLVISRAPKVVEQALHEEAEEQRLAMA